MVLHADIIGEYEQALKTSPTLMKIKRQEITREDILGHWRKGKSSLDWRRMTTKGDLDLCKQFSY